jgi:hypothetical protein
MTTPRPWRGVVVCETVDLTMDHDPSVVDLDLGELSHEPEGETPAPPLPLAERLSRLSATSRRVGWALAAIALVAAAVGWQVGGDRARNAAAARLQSTPPVMAWIIDDGPNDSSSPADPHTILELHVANLGTRPIRLNTLVPNTDRGFATATFLAAGPVIVDPGRTTSTNIAVHPDCASAYVKASLAVLFSAPAAGRPNERVVIDDSADPSLGNSFLLALNQVCARPTADRTENGVDGVFVEQTSSAVGAALVLTNGTPNPRRIQFATLESDGFELETSPGSPLVLSAGASISVFLSIKVDGCDNVARLTNWAEGATMEVSSPESGASADRSAPDSYSLREVVLAPLGAAVERACH